MTKKIPKYKRYHSKVDVYAGLSAACVTYSPPSTARSICPFDADNRKSYDEIYEESEPNRSKPYWKETPAHSSSEVKCERQQTLWEEIMWEYENERAEFKNLREERKPFEPEIPIGSKLSAVQYLEHYIFPTLCPALEDTLIRAKKEECLQIQKCVFNGLDHLSELLWNRNPMHPKRAARGYKNLFDIPFVKIWLYHNPRPIYPLSWIWTKEEAITVMQSYIRRYFVCRDHDCSEMRKFWQIFKQEKREEELLRQLEHDEEVRELVEDNFNLIIADAVYKAEWKIHGCFCIAKPCHCTCKCFKWCKCCRCYRPEKSVADQFYSYGITNQSSQRFGDKI